MDKVKAWLPGYEKGWPVHLLELCYCYSVTGDLLRSWSRLVIWFLLNSSFYQRYLGRRDTLRYAFVQQMLELPSHYPAADDEVMDEDMQELVEQIDTESEEHRNTNY